MSNYRMGQWVIFVLAILFSATAFGQVKSPILGTIINGGNFGPGQPLPPLQLDGNCNYVANFSVLVSNLQADAQGHYPFPQQGYPPMYLLITIDDETTCHEITEFFPHTGAPYNNIFYGGVDIPLSLNEYCFGNYPTLSSPVSFAIEWDVRIIQEPTCNEESALYPICSYTETHQLFANDVFILSYSNDLGCNNKKLAIHDGTFDLSCGDCDGIRLYEPSVKYDARLDSIEDKTRTTKPSSELAVAVMPNPFETTFTLSWPVSEHPLQQIELYDLQGHLLKQWSGTDLESAHYIQVDASTLPSGIYFTSFRYTDETLVKKIIKK